MIADEAGVSRAAVSMALRNHPRIPESTRLRIQKIARKLGWKPNPLLAEAMSAIRAGQPSADRVTLAWISTDDTRDGWRHSHFNLRCFAGAQQRAENAGYRLDQFWLGDADGNATRLSEILYTRGIAGIIVGPFHDRGRIAMQWDRFAAATFAHTLLSPQLHRATDNQFASARVSVARLHAVGCRRIGLALAARLDHRVADQWTAGYLLETFEEGLAHPKLLHRPPDLDEAEFIRWFKRAKPDAIVGTDKRIIEWLATAGIRVPDDVAFAGLDLADDSGEVAGIFQDASAIGASVIDLVAGQLLRHERGLPEVPRTVVIDGRWVDGATLPATKPDPEWVEKSAMLLATGGTAAANLPALYD
ncbi:LacI family DNA-binding transcriptional regulator [Synoicihabitans lomoniglobus]|nr:LacI family transcriptional regulator [Opitutaceae bacterium LMO-M01]